MFIAIMAADSPGIFGRNSPPLPNLEARIICADTLATVADPNWTPFEYGSFQTTMDEVNACLLRVAQIRTQWLTTHDEKTKQELRTKDLEARRELRRAIHGNMTSMETQNFADHALLEPDAPPANTDPRLLFYNDDMHGFDIVIGNPPYESIYKDLRPGPYASKERKKELTRETKARRNHLAVNKGYKTTRGKDLYNLIAEASLSLVRPEAGVVSLIVPLSLCFGQDQIHLRRLFERRCRHIGLRNQDIRPDKSFHDSPVEHPANSQRTTIVTATTGTGKPTIEVTGANKWRKSERYEYLSSRARVVTRQEGPPIHVDLDGQWERIPTLEIQELTSLMRKEPKKIAHLREHGANPYEVAFPLSARYFITATPANSLDRKEFTLPIAEQSFLELALAAANSHAAYAWWKVYGDAYHIKPSEVSTIAIPKPWLEHERTNRAVRELGQALIDAIGSIERKRITTGTKGTVQDSLNLHEAVAGTISAIDKLYLESLGLPESPLMEQLHHLRRDSTWKLGVYPKTVKL